MSDATMTLEELRGVVNRAAHGVQGLRRLDAIDAAIQERDELRKIERTARCEMIPDVVRWHERAEKAEAERDAARRECTDALAEAEDAEAELAALKKRIAEAPTTKVIQWYQESKDKNRRVIHYGMDHCYVGQRVRLLTEAKDVMMGAK